MTPVAEARLRSEHGKSHSPRWLPSRTGPPKASPSGVLLRTAGLWLWSRGVRAIPDGALRPSIARESSSAPVRVVRLAAVVVLCAAAMLFGLAAWGGLEMSRLERDFRRNPPGVSLDDCAAQVRQRTPAGGWSFLHPGIPRRLQEIAAEIESGRARLVDAARLYERCGERLADLGPLGRRAEGKEIFAPLVEMLDQIETPWHRETLAFREIDQVARAYLVAPDDVQPRLRGEVVALTPGHRVQVRLQSPEGRAETDALGPGQRFELPAVAGAMVVLRDMAAACPDCVLEIREEHTLSIARWSEKPVAFPRGGTSVQVRFDEETLAWAPLPAPLSQAVRKQLSLDGRP